MLDVPDDHRLDRIELVKQMHERGVVEALQMGDEAAFLLLVDTYQASHLRIALIYVHDHALAEEIVQETWIGVLHGINRFEGRSSLRTWIFKILTNTRERSVTYLSYRRLIRYILL